MLYNVIYNTYIYIYIISTRLCGAWVGCQNCEGASLKDDVFTRAPNHVMGIQTEEDGSGCTSRGVPKEPPAIIRGVEHCSGIGG